MNLTPLELDALHKNQLVILGEIQRVCRANGIVYFAIAGTLLGAVRHKGIIPWDDDIDIGMTRSQYNKFLSCANAHMGPEFFLQTWSTDPAFGLPMAKVRLNDTKIVESASADVDCHQGIFVDIFPFDDKPDAAPLRWLHALSAYVLKRAILARSGYSVGGDRSLLMRLSFRALTIGLAVFSKCRLIAFFEARMTQFNGFENTECVTIAGSYGYRRESLPKCWIEDLVDYDFDGMRVPGFRKAGPYLARMYGDFLKLPPVHERGQRHGIRAIDFGH